MSSKMRVVGLSPALDIQRWTQALSPGAIANKVTAEVAFTVPANVRLPADGIVFLCRRTTINGAVSHCAARVVSTTQIGVTWVNPTAAPVTPTAATLYDIAVIAPHL